MYSKNSEKNSIQDQICLQKVTEFKKKWQTRPDTTGKRLVSRILEMSSSSIIKAILIDDLNLFKNSYQKRDDNLSNTALFEIACLCGSSQITQHLIVEHHYNITDSEEAISYALSSGNFDFAHQIAVMAKKGGKTSPGNIYLYNSCKFSELKIIEKLFSEPLEACTNIFGQQ